MAAISSNGTGGGNWSAAATWNGGVVPTIGTDDVNIVVGDTVTIDTTGLGCGTDPGAGTAGLTINGTLNYITTASSGLTVRGQITVANGGTLYSGTQLPKAYKHTLSIDCVDTANKYRLIVQDGGTFKPYGELYSNWNNTIGSDVASAQATVTVGSDISSDWAAGMKVFLPSTDARQYDRGETKTINSIIDATSFDVTVNFTHGHVAKYATWFFDTPCVLLDRNITIQSTNTTFRSAVLNRSQTQANVNIRNVEFKDLGTSNTNLSLVWADTSGTPSNAVPATGNMSGCSFHGTGYPGFYYSTRDLKDAYVHSDCVFVGNYQNARLCTDTGASSSHLFQDCYFCNEYYVFGLIQNVYEFVGPHGFRDCWVCGYNSRAIYTRSTSNQVVLSGIKGLVCLFVVYQIVDNQNLVDFYMAGCARGPYVKGAYKAEGNNVHIDTSDWVFAIDDSVTSTGRFVDVFFHDTTDIYDVTDAANLGIYLQNIDGTDRDCLMYSGVGNMFSCKETFASPRDIVRTSGGFAVGFEPLDAGNSLTQEWSIATEANKQIVVSGYFRKTAAYNGATDPKVTLSGVGITETSQTLSVAAGNWELFTVSGTPTETGAAKFEFSCKGTAGYAYIDDVVVTAADVNTGDFDNWYQGEPMTTLFATKVDAAQLATDLADAVWDEAASDHTIPGSLGAKNQKVVPSETIGDYKADVSGLSTFDPSTDEVDVGKVKGVAVTDIDDFKADVSSLSTFDETTDTVTVGTNNDKTGYSLSAAGIQAIWDAATAALTTVGSIGKWIIDYLDAAITSRSTFDHTSDQVTVGNPNDCKADVSALASQATVDAIPTNPLLTNDARLDNLDATISSRLADADYTAPDNAGISSIESTVDEILDIEGGRWKIESNQMIFYKADGTTEVMRFNLFDEHGNPAMENIFDRVRV